MKPGRLSLAAVLVVALLSVSAGADARGKQKSSEEFAQAGFEKVQKGRYLDALQDYNKAIKMDKRNPNLYQLRANAFLGASKFKDAVSDASKSIKYAPDDANGYLLRVRAYEPMEEWKKEREDLDHLVILKPNDSTILLQRAQTCSKLKEMEQVIQDCNKAINMGLERQQLADLYKMRAVAYKKLGKKSEAKQEMAKYESLK